MQTFFLLSCAALVVLGIALLAGWARARSGASEFDPLREFSILAETLDHTVWTSTPNGDIRFSAGHSARYSGIAHEDLVQHGIRALIHPDDLPATKAAWSAALRDGTEFRHESRFRRRDGIYRWHRHRALPLHDPSGRITGWIGSTIDIDDDRRVIDSLVAAVDDERRSAEENARLAERLRELYAASVLPHTRDLRFSAWYQTTGEGNSVGGDWCKAQWLDGDRILFAIGDVSGHGVEAAVAMGRARQTILAIAMTESDPAEILRRTNAVMLLQDTIVTAVVAILSTATGRIDYAVAGHPAPIVIAPDGNARLLANDGIPLGVQGEVDVAACSLQLLPGARLILYTDGLIEFDRDVIRAEQTLLATASSLASYDEDDIAERLGRLVLGSAPLRDDVAILTLSNIAAAATAARPEASLLQDA